MNYPLEEMRLTELWIRKQLSKHCDCSWETYASKLDRAGFTIKEGMVGSVMIFSVTK